MTRTEREKEMNSLLSESETTILLSIKDRWVHETFHAGAHCEEDGIKEGVAWLYSLKKRKRPEVVIVDSPLAFLHKQIGRVPELEGRRKWYKHRVRACFESSWTYMEEELISLIPLFLMKKQSGAWQKVYRLHYLEHIDNVINSTALTSQSEELFFILTRIYTSIDITSEESLLMMLGKIIRYDFLRETGQIESALFDELTRFLRSGCFLTELFLDCAVVIKRPAFTRLNNSLRLHSEDGPAIQWRDGHKVYCLNGIPVSEEVVMTPAEQLDPMIILKTENAEIRKELITKIGVDNLITAFKGKSVDRWQGYELIQLSFPDMQFVPVYLKMINPSTGALHFEGVPPEITTCREALSWRVGGLDWNPQQLT